jgi:hypothetical protein
MGVPLDRNPDNVSLIGGVREGAPVGVPVDGVDVPGSDPRFGGDERNSDCGDRFGEPFMADMPSSGVRDCSGNDGRRAAIGSGCTIVSVSLSLHSSLVSSSSSVAPLPSLSEAESKELYEYIPELSSLS